MRLGIDLDNTIVNYDNLFVTLAVERELLPPQVARNKQAIRDYLRAQGLEDRWTELQGIAYGSRMQQAVPFEGVQEFFRRCEAAGVQWWIISHRTERPYLGDPVSLHDSARQWLARQGFVSGENGGRIMLETTREWKIQRIKEAGCDTFIDDLPELLIDAGFPHKVRRILFDPFDQNPDRPDYERARSWFEIAKRLGV